jgi:LysM repeat protein
MLWALFMGIDKKPPNTYKAEKGATMNKGTRNQLEIELKKMLNPLDQAKTKEKLSIPQSSTGNIIRRRKGQKDKRFFSCM